MTFADRNPGPSAPTAVSPGRLVAWVGAALGLGLILTGLLVVALGSRPEWWRAWASAAFIGLVSATASVPLLLGGLARLRAAPGDATGDDSQLHGAVRRVLLAGALRMMIVAIGVIVSVRLLGTAKWPTFGFAGALYLLVMVAEVGLVGRALWRADAARQSVAG